MAVLIETSLGDITVDLFTEERPRASLNFLKLCKTKYYNFCLFHSVQRNLVAQTGDPIGSGKGGQSVFADLYGEQAVYFEMETVPRIKHRQKGLISMVNNGNDGHGSQFFFTLAEDLDYLDGVHTVIGEVAEGLDVLDKINEVYCDEQHRPYKDIRIYHTIILDDPYPDPDGLVVPDKSPEPTKEQLDSGRIGADEDIDDNKGLTEAQVQESLDKKEAQANAQILEMVGDLPDADVKPPDCVLFVCKLNPVTTSEDLEIIFSRFGTIVSCDVIKDQKTEESLQYAFIEFEKPEDCESAYFKMDNVLIDDRRIHVDFSQSVSKIKFPDGKGEGKQGVFGSQYKIKDTTRKDHKYDLVFEDNHKKPKDKNEDRRKDEKRQKSRSRSRDRSPLGRKSKRSRSRSPKRHRDTDRKYKDERSRDNDSNNAKRRHKEKHRRDENRDSNYRKEKRRGSSSENLSDHGLKETARDSKKLKNKSSSKYYRNKSSSDSSDTESNHRKNKTKSSKSKTDNSKRQNNLGHSDDSSPERFQKKPRKKQQQSETDSSSDEKSKTKKKSARSYRQKSKQSSSDNESDNDTTKSRHRRGDSRERTVDKYERNSRDKRNRRDLEDRSYGNKDRYDYDRHSDRKEKRHKDRR